MPEVFRFFGFSFFFYSKEHEPVHVHVEGNNDLKKIKAVIDENADLIIKRWEEHFNS